MTDGIFIKLMEIEGLRKQAAELRMYSVFTRSAQLAWKMNHSACRCLARADRLSLALANSMENLPDGESIPPQARSP